MFSGDIIIPQNGSNITIAFCCLSMIIPIPNNSLLISTSMNDGIYEF